MNIFTGAKRSATKLIMSSSLKITEIFYSLQGETSTVGLPTVFVRLTGCPLRCSYCDTAYAFHGGTRMPLESIYAEVERLGATYITVTGGEPLAQKPCIELLEGLCDRGYKVSLETSGALSIEEIDDRVAIILDIKTPGSGEVIRNLYDNIPRLKPIDEVKFVICDRQDYEWARLCLDQYAVTDKTPNVLFSPHHDNVPAAELADWIIADRLPVRLQLQLHKYLWNDEPGR